MTGSCSRSRSLIHLFLQTNPPAKRCLPGASTVDTADSVIASPGRREPARRQPQPQPHPLTSRWRFSYLSNSWDWTPVDRAGRLGRQSADWTTCGSSWLRGRMSSKEKLCTYSIRRWGACQYQDMTTPASQLLGSLSIVMALCLISE